MVKIMEETTDCAKRFCVRFDDNKKKKEGGLNTKFYKTFRNKLMGERYKFCMKYLENGARGLSPQRLPQRLARKYQKFWGFRAALKPKAFPEGFKSFSPENKQKTVKKLVGELDDELAVAMSHGPVQVNNAVQIQGVEVCAAAPNPDLDNPLSNDASLQNVPWNQRDNSQGRPPSRPPVPLTDLVLIFRDLADRASCFPGWLPEFHFSEEQFTSFIIKLESLEGALKDDRNTLSRSCEGEIFPRVDLSAYEDPQNVTSMPEGLADKCLADEYWSNLLASPEA